MNTEPSKLRECGCDAASDIHAAGCQCSRRAEEFLAAPTRVYLQSRRAFLQTLLVGGAAAGFALVEPQEANADIFTPSVADQKKLGDQAAQQVLQKYREVRDSRGRHFESLGSRLVDALPAKDRNTWDYRFHVIESKDVNAFAVPGGNMFMFTGLMDRITSDDELAAVTGHEMTHVRKQHWAKATANATKRQLGIQVLLGVTHAGQGWQTIAGLGDTLLSLKYSRSEEDEADAGGLQKMVDAHYDPHGMLDLFHLLQTSSNGRGEPPAFLSDHPLTKDRIKKAQERIDKLYG
jgi:predicted Zn-dependent protease